MSPAVQREKCTAEGNKEQESRHKLGQSLRRIFPASWTPVVTFTSACREDSRMETTSMVRMTSQWVSSCGGTSISVQVRERREQEGGYDEPRASLPVLSGHSRENKEKRKSEGRRKIPEKILENDGKPRLRALFAAECSRQECAQEAGNPAARTKSPRCA